MKTFVAVIVVAVFLFLAWAVVDVANRITSDPPGYAPQLSALRASLDAASIGAHTRLDTRTSALAALPAGDDETSRALRADVAAAAAAQRASVAGVDAFVFQCRADLAKDVRRNHHYSWTRTRTRAATELADRNGRDAAADVATAKSIAQLRDHAAQLLAPAAPAAPRPPPPPVSASDLAIDDLAVHYRDTVKINLVFAKNVVDEAASGAAMPRLLRLASSCRALRLELSTGAFDLVTATARLDAVKALLVKRGVPRATIKALVPLIADDVLLVKVVVPCPLERR